MSSETTVTTLPRQPITAPSRRPWQLLRRAALAALCGSALACSSSTSPPSVPPEAGPSASAASQQGPATPAPTSSAAASASPELPGPAPERCGKLDCWLFDQPEQAFAYVLQTRPKILAIGEAHAQRDKTNIDSTTKRFTEQLLPKLEGRTTDIVVELWVASGACGKVETKVAKQQKQVTEKQASTNTNEFVVMGHAAKRLGIVPYVLRPSCDEYKEIASAGDDAPAKMLTMITRLTVRKLQQLAKAREEKPVGPKPMDMLVAYGGLMHNDLQPAPERKQWSFAAELREATGGRYVELDLIVPEFIRDTESWKSLPWYGHFDKDAHPDKTTLIRPNPGSYVLVFPRSKR